MYLLDGGGREGEFRGGSSEFKVGSPDRRGGRCGRVGRGGRGGRGGGAIEGDGGGRAIGITSGSGGGGGT